jgi:hypothetical protein
VVLVQREALRDGVCAGGGWALFEIDPVHGSVGNEMVGRNYEVRLGFCGEYEESACLGRVPGCSGVDSGLGETGF